MFVAQFSPKSGQQYLWSEHHDLSCSAVQFL